MKNEQTMISGEIPESTYEYLPQWLKEIVELVEPGLRRDYLLLGALCVGSSLFKDLTAVYDGKLIRPNLFVFLIAPAGMGKGDFALAEHLINNIIKNEDLIHDREIRAWSISGDPQRLKPPHRSLKIPGNISSAALIESLSLNDGYGLLFESEADVLNVALGQEWGNFSDILRKSWANETISSKRKSEEFSIKNPRLSVGLSGTPNQFYRLIDNTEDGLFSRPLYYWTNNFKLQVRDVFKEKEPIESLISEQIGLFFKVYRNARGSVVKYELSANQNNRILECMQRWFEKYQEDYTNVPKGILTRVGVQVMKVAMTLDGINFFSTTGDSGKLNATDNSINFAIELVNSLLEHAIVLYNHFPKQRSKIKVKPTVQLLCENLPPKFSTKVLIATAALQGLSPRTAHNYRKELMEQGCLKQIKPGEYEKVDNS